MTAQPERSMGSSLSLPIRFIATAAFSGYSPIAPGTAGSLLALVLYTIPGIENPLTLGILSAALFFLGVYVSGRMEPVYGKDPSIVVIDEFVGMWISLLLLPKSIAVGVAAFLIFRLLDILKPFPVRSSEKLPWGWGIMVDDLICALLTNGIVRLASVLV